MIKLSISIIVLSVKMEHSIKTLCTGKGTFELRYGTAESSRMEKRQSARALQQRIQPKRDIANTASWISYSK
jgi:hypothetical protein